MPALASTARRLAAVAAVAAVALVPATAQAQNVVVHTTLASWVAAMTNPAVDTYDDLPPALVNSPITRTAGAYSYRAASANNIFAAGSAADRWLSHNTATDPLVLDNFSANVRGVGGYLFLSDIAGLFIASGQLNVQAVVGGQVRNVGLVNPNTLTFWGITADAPITSFTLQSVTPNGNNTQVWSTINDLRLGTAAPSQVVPEPSTYVLLATGIGALGLVARRRTKA